MKKLFTLLAATIALVSLNTAHADMTEGFYVDGFGGANFIQTSKKHGEHFKFDTGWYAGASLGYKWCNGLRLEGEGSYRRNRIRSFRVEDIEFHAKGHFESTSWMANALYEISLYDCGCCEYDIAPYFGGGIGYVDQKIKLRDRKEDLEAHGKKRGFGWQVLAGITWRFSDCFDASVEYRFHEGRARRIYDHSVGGVLKCYF